MYAGDSKVWHGHNHDQNRQSEAGGARAQAQSGELLCAWSQGPLDAYVNPPVESGHHFLGDL